MDQDSPGDVSPMMTPAPLSPSPPPPPQLTAAGRPKRNYRVPARYEDVNPEPLRPLRQLEEENEQPSAISPLLPLIARNHLRTVKNSFGLVREYLHRPSFDPDSFIHKKELHPVGGPSGVPMQPPPPPAPIHQNKSVEIAHELEKFWCYDKVRR